MPQSTPEAHKLAEALRELDWDVEEEWWDGHKHVDIWVEEAQVAIEVDGSQHNLDMAQALADLKRTVYSIEEDQTTLRIPNSLLRDKNILEETADWISDFLKESAGQLEEEDDDEIF